MSSWDVPAPPLPSQTSTMPESPLRMVRRGELEHVLESARSTSDEIITATAAQREAVLEQQRKEAAVAQREQETLDRTLAQATEVRHAAWITGLRYAAGAALGVIALGLLARSSTSPRRRR